MKTGLIRIESKNHKAVKIYQVTPSNTEIDAAMLFVNETGEENYTTSSFYFEHDSITVQELIDFARNNT